MSQTGQVSGCTHVPTDTGLYQLLPDLAYFTVRFDAFRVLSNARQCAIMRAGVKL
jgi:hypothetical protein